MKLIDSILLSASAGFFIIGVHQMITVGLTQAYWVFMLSTALLIGFQIRKQRQKEEEGKQTNNSHPKKTMKGNRKRNNN